jgi:hypothetical protein
MSRSLDKGQLDGEHECELKLTKHASSIWKSAAVKTVPKMELDLDNELVECATGITLESGQCGDDGFMLTWILIRQRGGVRAG